MDFHDIKPVLLHSKKGLGRSRIFGQRIVEDDDDLTEFILIDIGSVIEGLVATEPKVHFSQARPPFSTHRGPACCAVEDLMESEADAATGFVVAVSRGCEHRFSKVLATEITIVAGLGVEGDAHNGVKVQHRSRVVADPTQPNFRQVHLIHTELFEELGKQGFKVSPGEMGENIATRGINLLGLPRGSLLRVGPRVVLEVMGLRNPCAQVERF